MSIEHKKRYSEKLRDPRWQRKRLLILERDEWTCQFCGADDVTLHVHHKFYIPDREPWDYDDDILMGIVYKANPR